MPSLIFSGFVFAGVFSREKDNKYVKINSVLSKDNLSRGMPIKRQAVSKDITLKKLIKIADAHAVNEIDVYDGETIVKRLNQKQITEILVKGDLYSRLERYI